MASFRPSSGSQDYLRAHPRTGFCRYVVGNHYQRLAKIQFDLPKKMIAMTLQLWAKGDEYGVESSVH
jgi:hypothetical protein